MVSLLFMPAWWNGRHSGLKIRTTEGSTPFAGTIPRRGFIWHVD